MTVVELLARSSVVIGVGLLVLWCMRRQPAAFRHWILALAIMLAALQPAIQFVIPDWAIPEIALPRQAVTAPFATEQPEVYERAELIEKFGTDDDRLIEKAKKLGLLVDLGEDRYEAPSPALIRAAEEVLAMGIELPDALAAIEKLNRNAQSSARTFVELFVEEVWKPFDDAGRPEEGWEEIIAAIGRLRPLAFDALNATFRLTLTTEIEKAFGEVLERRQKKKK